MSYLLNKFTSEHPILGVAFFLSISLLSSAAVFVKHSPLSELYMFYRISVKPYYRNVRNGRGII